MISSTRAVSWRRDLKTRYFHPMCPSQPCYDTCTSIVRYSIILGLNTLIGWRAYFNTRQAVGGSGERGVLEETDLLGKFHLVASLALGVTKAPHFRRPSCTRGHTVTMTNRGRPGCVAHPSTSRRSSSTASTEVLVRLLRLWRLGNHFAFRATRRRRRFKPTRASTERRSLLAQARIRIAASRARISRGTTGRSAACGRVRDRDVHALRVR